MAKDFYEILGVSRTSSPDEIKKAYRKLAHEFHPDKAHGDTKKHAENEAKFKEINEAYQVLADEKKRKQYDQFGSAGPGYGGFGGGGASGFGGFGGQGGVNIDFEDLEDLFGGVFRGFGGGGGRGQRRGRDIGVDVTITFRESVFGAVKEVTLHKPVVCSECKGSGADKDSKVATCTVCNGKGQVAHVQNTIFGAIQTVQSCTNCDGLGTKPEKACATCSGSGTLKSTVSIPVHIPGGVQEGQTLELRGEGEAGKKGTPSGNLHVNIHVTPEKGFERRDDDIWTSLELSFSEVALGTKKDVETVDGVVTLTIPEGTQTGKIFRLNGKGVTHLHSRGRGDHFVEVKVLTPTKLSKRQKEILKELDSQ